MAKTVWPAPVRDWLVEHDPLVVEPWIDPEAEARGFRAQSLYVETFWLPIIGPSSLLALRHLNRALIGHDWSYTIEHAVLAFGLGLGGGTGRRSPLVNTLDRMVKFNVARVVGDVYQVRTFLPQVSRRRETQVAESL